MSSAIKALRNIALSVLVIVMIMVAAAGIYVWASGKDSDKKINDNSAKPATTVGQSPIKPRPKPSPTAKVGASVQMIESPVAPGKNTSLTIKTNAGAKCTISVVYGSMKSTDSGLSQKIADDFGLVTWTWTVESSAPLGTWPVKVTCANKANSAAVQADLVVAAN
jgi:hypothetical protein